MRPRVISRLLAVVVTASVIGLGCAQIAGLDDPSSSSSGTSGTSSSGGEAGAATGELQVEPKRIDFDPTDCGNVASKKLTVFNRTKFPAEYKVRSVDPIFEIKAGASGTIAAGGAADVEVTARPTLAQRHETSLQIELNGATSPYPVTVLGQGPTIELSQTAVDFGDVRKDNGGETKVIVKNAGGKPLNTSFEPTAPTSDFEILPALVHADPDGKTAEITVRMKSGVATAAAIVAAFKPKATGVCGAIPQLDVRGKRIITDVTIDVVDWGDVACKTTPPDRNAIIKNYASTPITITTALTGTTFAFNGTPPTSVPGATGTPPTLDPGTQAIKLKVTPGTTPGQKDETLTVTYGAMSSTGKVRAYVYGLVLAIAPGSGSFTSDGTSEQRRTFNITNTSAGKFGGFFNISAGYQATGAGFRTEKGTSNYQNVFGFYTNGAVDVVYKAQSAAPVTGELTVSGAICSQNTVTLNGSSP